MRPMCPFSSGIALLSLVGAAHAEGAAPSLSCMPPREMQEVLAETKIVAPAAAVITARRAVQGADLLRAALCRDGDDLIYLIVALRKDGRVVQVTIDAPSGKVKSVH